MRRRATALVGVLAAVVGAGFIPCASATAAPGDYAITYDWSGGPPTGYAGWGARQTLPASGGPFSTPFYRSTFEAPTPGIGLQPSPADDGTRDREYPRVEEPPRVGGVGVISQVSAPGTTVIRRALFEDATYRRSDGERQIARFAVYGDGPDGVYDTTETAPPPGPFFNDVTYTVPRVTVDHPDGRGTSAQFWFYTACDPDCPTVRFDGPAATPRSFAQLGRLRLELADPELPTLELGGELASGGWTNGRNRRSLTITSSDPGSGVRRVQISRRRGTSGPFVVVQTRDVACDDDHTDAGRAGREAAPCPDRDELEYTPSVAGLSNGEYTLRVAVTDDAERTTAKDVPLRIDRTAPDGLAVQGEITRLLGRWTNRSDRVGATLIGRDAPSGLRSIELVGLDRSRGPVVVASLAGDCSPIRCATRRSGPSAVDLGALGDGRPELRLRAVDLSGNVREQRVGRLQLDRTPPSAPRGRARLTPSSAFVSLTRSADPSPGSGLERYELRYRVRTSSGNVLTRRRVVAAGEVTSTSRGGGIRVQRPADDRIAVIAVDRAGNESPEATVAIVPFVIRAVTAACAKFKKACTAAVRKACKVSGPICRRAKRIACSKLKVFCPKRGRPSAAQRRAARLRRLRRGTTVRTPGWQATISGRDRFNRATKIRARVTREGISRRRARGDAPPARTKDVPGWRSGCRGVVQRGHLLARAFGGPADHRNLTAIPGYINNGSMKAAENALKREIVRRGGEWRIEVKPRYKGTDPIPQSIKVVAKRRGRFGGRLRYPISRSDFRRTINIPRSDPRFRRCP